MGGRFNVEINERSISNAAAGKNTSQFSSNAGETSPIIPTSLFSIMILAVLPGMNSADSIASSL